MESSSASVFTPEWCTAALRPPLPRPGRAPPPVARVPARHCPVAHSDQYGGYWLVTRYEDVMRVAQDWETFSSAEGVTVPMPPATVAMIIPEMVDPPLHREYKRLINAYFTQSVVMKHEQGVRDIVTRLIDAFIEDGRVEFQEKFARPFPGAGVLRARDARAGRRGAGDGPAHDPGLGVHAARRERGAGRDHASGSPRSSSGGVRKVRAATSSTPSSPPRSTGDRSPSRRSWRSSSCWCSAGSTRRRARSGR